MSYSETLAERNRYRVRLELDEYAPEPYDCSQSPLLRLNKFYGSVRVEHIQVGDRPTDDDAAIENAIAHWATTPSDGDWPKFEKYLRAFFGVRNIVTYFSGSYWYVTYDSEAWRKSLGFTNQEQEDKYAKPEMAEYKAWIEGDCYSYVVEKQVEWMATEYDAETFPTKTTWEVVDSCGGYYGEEYAREAALEAFESEAGE